MMTLEKRNPGAGGTGVKIEFEAAKLRSQYYTPPGIDATAFEALPTASQHRLLWADALKFALEHCEWQQAATICATYLDEIGAGFPRLDWWGDIRAEADEWAFRANSGELEVYFIRALNRLENQALGIKARKRLLAALFQSMSAADQTAFLKWAAGVAQ